MNYVRTFIISGLIFLLICLTAGIHTSIKLNRELNENFHKIDLSVTTAQSALYDETSNAWIVQILLNLNDNDTIAVLNNTSQLLKSPHGTTDIIKNTLVQREFRQSIDNSNLVLANLTTAANNVSPNKIKLTEYETLKSAVQDLTESNKRLQEIRNSTYELIKDYNKRFDSIPVIFLASILGYNKLPIYII